MDRPCVSLVYIRPNHMHSHHHINSHSHPALPPSRERLPPRSPSPPSHHSSYHLPPLNDYHHPPPHPRSEHTYHHREAHSRPSSRVSDSRQLPPPPPSSSQKHPASASAVTEEVTPPASPPHTLHCTLHKYNTKIQNPLEAREAVDAPRLDQQGTAPAACCSLGY